MATVGPATGGGGAFLTQRNEKLSEVKKDIEELEGLLGVTAQTSQSTLLLKKRKEMREIDDSLKLMKANYKKRMEDCEERRITFEKKQADMREGVIRFEKFIQENDAKRLRAEAKSKAERKAYEERVKELGALANRIEEMEAQQKLLHEDLVKKSRYKEYLEKIIEEGEYGYEEVADILARHKTLKDANKDLMNLSDEQDFEVNEMRKRLQALKTEAQNKLLVGNSVLHSHQKELETVRGQAKEAEEHKDELEDKKKDISRESSQVIQAIRNIFARCQSSMRNNNTTIYTSNKEPVTMADMLIMNLEVICGRMEDLSSIIKEYQDASANMNSNLAGNDLGEPSTSSASTAQVPGLNLNASGNVGMLKESRSGILNNNTANNSSGLNRVASSANMMGSGAGSPSTKLK